MNFNDIEEKVIRIIHEIAQNNKASTWSSLRTLGLDSLDAVDIIMRLENEFGIEISDEDAASVSNVHDLCVLVERLLEEKAQSLCVLVERLLEEKAQSTNQSSTEASDDFYFLGNDVDFGADWDYFTSNVNSFIQERRKTEELCGKIQWKIKNLEYKDPNTASCYAFMGAFLCFYYIEYAETTENGDNWARKNGRKFMLLALKQRPYDEEFQVVSSIFELIELIQVENNVHKFFERTQQINKQCPAIETISDSLITTEALREWYNNTYYWALYVLVIKEDINLENNIPLKIEAANSLKNSSYILHQLTALCELADANFDAENYKESERYATLGKNLIENITTYDSEDDTHIAWGNCWTLYAKCQEQFGEIEFAVTLYERGCQIGVPECMEELARLYETGVGVEKNMAKAQELKQMAEFVNNGGKASDFTPQVENTEKQEAESTNQTPCSPEEINSISADELEYIEELQACMEDDGQIGSSERRLLNKLRMKLGISEERAAELEASLQEPQLTEEEQEYLDAYMDAMEDGVISDSERRLLNKLMRMNGISEDRAKELEMLIK